MKNIRSLIVAIAATVALGTAGFAVAETTSLDCCKKDAACCAKKEACCAPANAKGSCCVTPEVNRCCAESATSNCCK